ncbi:Mitochondrial Rho GTPase [Aphelenchoides besseyi]|nr:Mitochondrial Rho GTPase [Aphelenchoides besseyi]KAI6228073.1 Mitochondrial Rho GTPase [Aphelenchoides besseyi]
MRADLQMAADNEIAEYNEDEVDVRILVIGDRGCGKTSILSCLLEDRFVHDVPANLETVLIPSDVTADGVVTAIVDYSPREHEEKVLEEMIRSATVFVIVFSVEKEENLERIRTYWMPLIHRILNDEQRPVLIVANKTDLSSKTDDKSDYISKMVPLMNEFGEIETVVECSALAKKNVSEVFYYAQRAVIYPMAPLYDVNRRELTTRFKKALVRIFKLSDIDGDGLLSDQELKIFQMRAFGMPLTDEALEEVKNVVMSYETDGVIDSGISLRGFFYLHEAFMQRGRQETAWMCLRRFGYNRLLQLSPEYLYPSINIPMGSSTELSETGIAFLCSLFKKFDEDRDGKLSPLELKNLLSVCPSHAWPTEFLHSSVLDENGFLSQRAFINLWNLNVYMNLTLAFEHLAYLGFNIEHQNQLEAIVITRDRRIDIAEKSTERNVFQCHVIGPKNAGKTVFCRSFLGETLNRVMQLRPNQQPTYVINTVDVKGLTKYMIMHEVDVYSADDQLTNYETNADVICLLYDGTDPNSFAYCAKLYLRYFYRTKVPVLFVASKSSYEFEQQFEFQPSDFCLTHQLPKPLRFAELGNSQAVVFSTLCTMATFPHLKRVYFLHDSSLLSKFAFGASIAALVGFLVYKNILCNGIKIDNSLINSRPRLECLSNSIVVHAQTSKPFYGRVYVKGQSHSPSCSVNGDGQTTLSSLHLPFENCFLRRQRVFAPHPGIIVSTTVVISFHPLFVTEADAAYRLQCVYLNSEQTVNGNISLLSQELQKPSCKYEILEAGPNGRAIPTASVGSVVYHKWQCKAMEGKYCALVHSCKIDDGAGVEYSILDERGCSKDPILLRNLEYIDDLSAGQSALVYKFADRQSIFFQCQIMITRKDGPKCERPKCLEINQTQSFEKVHENNPQTFVNFDRRAARRALSRKVREAIEVDVLNELDVYEFALLNSSSLIADQEHVCTFVPLTVIACILLTVGLGLLFHITRRMESRNNVEKLTF